MNTRSILEILRKAGRTTDTLLNIVAGTHADWYRDLMRRAYYPTMPDFSKIKKDRELLNILNKKKHIFYSTLYRLRKQGLVEKKGETGRKTYWQITRRGMDKLDKLSRRFNLPKKFYKKEKDEGFNIVSFDIPEGQRFKRDWVRENLILLGFTMLHKSVWIGRDKIPEAFLKDLDSLDLMDFIHIFKVTKTGTIRKV